jgi:hypothetical protein
VITVLIAAPIVRIVIMIMMEERCLATYRASRIVLHLSDHRMVRCELMITVTAEIFLITLFIFAETIKRMRIVALRTFK